MKDNSDTGTLARMLRNYRWERMREQARQLRTRLQGAYDAIEQYTKEVDMQGKERVVKDVVPYVRIVEGQEPDYGAVSVLAGVEQFEGWFEITVGDLLLIYMIPLDYPDPERKTNVYIHYFERPEEGEPYLTAPNDPMKIMETIDFMKHYQPEQAQRLEACLDSIDDIVYSVLKQAA